MPAFIWPAVGPIRRGKAEPGRRDSRELVPFPGGASGNGAVGGGQVGWNYQAGPWVLGVEAAISAADINAGTACAAGAFICSVNVDGLGTATGRLGFAFDQFLVYGKAGAAVEHSRDAMVLRPFTAFSFNGSATRSGWTAGTGVEFAFNPALSAFAEYDFLDFGTRGIAMIDFTGVGARVALSEHVHLVKVGLNYKLGQNLSSWTAAARALPLFPVPPASLNWTGVYIGGHVGGGWGQTNWNSATGVLGNGTTVFAGSGTDNGFAIGGQVGVNYQVGPWVMGFEADAAGRISTATLLARLRLPPRRALPVTPTSTDLEHWRGGWDRPSATCWSTARAARRGTAKATSRWTATWLRMRSPPTTPAGVGRSAPASIRVHPGLVRQG